MHHSFPLRAGLEMQKSSGVLLIPRVRVLVSELVRSPI